jgi:hypothetical protein
VLAPGPPSGLHTVADHGGEGADRQVLVAFESEDRRAVGLSQTMVKATTDIESR